MNIKMNIIGLVVLVAIQLTCTKALSVADKNEELKLDLEDPPAQISDCLNIYQNEADLHNVIDTFTFVIQNYTSYFAEIFGSAHREFEPPPDDEMKRLEEEIKKIKLAIEAIKDQATENSCTKEKLIILQAELEKFEKQLADNLQGVWESLEEYRKVIQELTDTVNDLKAKLAELENSFEANKVNILRGEVIAYIKGGENEKALREFAKIGGDLEEMKGHINYIVHEVYNNNAGNFEHVLRFADQGKNTTIILATYEALKFEMESNSHTGDYIKILRLLNSINRKIINNSAAPANNRKGAEQIKRSLHGYAKDSLVELLKPKLVHQDWLGAKTISGYIDNFYPEVYKEVISEIILYEYRNLEMDQLVYYFMSLDYAYQSIFGYSAVFEEMRQHNRLDEYSIVDIAFGLKKALDKNNDPAAADEGSKLKYLLPGSARTLAFSYKVCFRSVVNGYEYLYAPTDGFKYDKDRRNIFTWVPGDKVNQAYWELYHYNGSWYEIRNTLYDEFLYSADDYFNYDSDRRRVFTWVGGGKGDKFFWLFEPQGNNLYIKNIYYWEYLLADDQKKYTDSRRYTFTWRNKQRTGDSLWTVESC